MPPSTRCRSGGSPSTGAFLAQDLSSPIHPPRHLWGFNGLHGGLALALMTSTMQQHAPVQSLRNVTAHFHRAIIDDFEITTIPLRVSERGTTAAATATGRKGVCAEATAVFGTAGSPPDIRVAPAPPEAPPPVDCETFSVPTEFVPFADQTEIRPVGPNRPYAGGTDPELTAWIRLVEDDRPPDAQRLVFLMDALAPSIAAVLSDMHMVPTVELCVRPGDGLRRASSPWVLLSARTLGATADGWIDERIDAWGPDGVHLGGAQQLRLVRGASP